MRPALSWDDLRELMELDADPVVSIYQPMHIKGPETRQNPIRLKTALKQARELLAQRDMEPERVEALLAPAAGLVEDTWFWQHQGLGLAILLWGGGSVVRRLPYEVHPQVHVQPQPVLRPLLPLYEPNNRFFVLVVSQHEARLLECTRDGVRRMTPDDVPAGMQELMRQYEEDRSLQFHTGAGSSGVPGQRPAIFHGHGASGSDETLRKQRVLEYFQVINRALSDLLTHEHASLLLACVGWEAALYRQANTYRHLIDEVLEGNHEHLDDWQVYEKAQELMRPRAQQSRDETLRAYEQARGSAQAAAGSRARCLPRQRGACSGC